MSCKFCASPVGFSCPLQGPDYDLALALGVTGRPSPAGYDVVDVCSAHWHALQIVIKACSKLEKLKRTLAQTLEAISGESAVIDAFAAKLEAHESAHLITSRTKKNISPERFSLLELE